MTAKLKSLHAPMRTRRHRKEHPPHRALAWAASMALVTTFVMVPASSAIADDAPAGEGASETPAETPVEAPVEAEAEKEQPAPAEAEADETVEPSGPESGDEELAESSTEAPDSDESSAAPQVSLQATAAPIVAAAFDEGSFGFSVSPSTVEQGDSFTVTLTGCPGTNETETYRLPNLASVRDPNGINVIAGNNVLGGIRTSLANLTAPDPWVLTQNVAIDAMPGDYVITPSCITRDGASEPFVTFFGTPTTLTVVASFDANDLGITVSPHTVYPGDDFTFTMTGCPYLTAPGGALMQLPVLQAVYPDLVTNVSGSDDVLGGVRSGLSATSADPWVHSATVAADAPAGGFRIYSRCQRRDVEGEPFVTVPGPYTTLNVLALPEPSETISPDSGYVGDLFTATITNCPTGQGPGGSSITQSALDHSGPMSFIDAFDFVSADHFSEPKTYVWEVADGATPGEYTIVFRCYTSSTDTVTMNPLTFTVLEDPFVFDGESSITPATGSAGDEFTITGTGCTDGTLNVGIGDPPGFLAFEDFELVGENAGSGADPMWFTLLLTDSAEPGIYTWEITCTVNGDEYEYEPVVYTLLETVDNTPDDLDEAAEDDSLALLPDTGAPVSLSWLAAALMAVMLGGVSLVTGRRQN